MSRPSPRRLRLALAWIRLVAPLVPAEHRRRWRQEWQGELCHAESSGRLRWHRALPALAHAAAFRVQSIRPEPALQDARYAIRQIRRYPGFSAVVVATLALGIGANALVYSVLDSTVLNPLAFRDADRLVYLWRKHPINDWMVSPHMSQVRAWREQVGALEQIEVIRQTMLAVTGDGDPTRIQGARVTPRFFDFVGVRPRLGRAFDPSEAIEGADRVVVITDGLWRERFASDPDVVGRDLRLDGEQHTIVGVLPDGYRAQAPLAGARLYAPLVEDDSARGFTVLARLREGSTAEQANAEMTALAAGANADTVEAWAGVARSPTEMQSESYRRAIWAFQGSVAFVLLIAIVNVANLSMARSESRRRELAIRGAIGGTRRRLVRQLLVESLVLATIGGTLGLLGAAVAVQVIDAVRPDDLRFLETLRLDPRAAAATAMLAVVAGLGIGLVPALQATARPSSTELADNPRAGAGGSRRRLRSLLVVVEVALSVVLLVGATLLVQSFLRVQALDPGFDTARVLTMRISLSDSAYPDAGSRAAFWRRLQDRLLGSFGSRIEAVSLASGAPPASGIEFGAIEPEGRPPITGDGDEVTAANWVGSSYFRALGIPLRAGRIFSAEPEEGDTPVVVSESFARSYWPGEASVGRRFRYDENERWRRIVGVVGDVRPYGLTTDRGARHIYYPLAGDSAESLGAASLTLIVRSAGAPLALARAVREAVWSLDDEVPVTDIATLAELQGATVALPRFNAQLMTAFAAIALLLALVGVYGVLSYAVAQRTHELGVRRALGATRRRLLRMVAREGLGLMTGGLIAGSIAAAGLARFLTGMLYGMAGPGASTYAAAIVVLAAVGIVATLLPARRATRVDPMTALRTD